MSDKNTCTARVQRKTLANLRGLAQLDHKTAPEMLEVVVRFYMEHIGLLDFLYDPTNESAEYIPVGRTQ